MTLILFEDDAVERFSPLVWTRPVFDLRCGILTLGEAIEQAYGTRAAALLVRPFLAGTVQDRTGLPVNQTPQGDGTALLVNGRVLADRDMTAAVPLNAAPQSFWTAAGELVAAAMPLESVDHEWRRRVNDLDRRMVNWPLVERPWDLFTLNAARIGAQAAAFNFVTIAPPGVHLVNAREIHVAKSATIQPGVVLDASGGPLVIDEGALVMANAVLQGPSYIGPHSQIKIGAKIYHGTTIGPWCKIGGEVEESVFLGYANKQHDGFIGHSVVGEWCNLGADTNNSDLKNNYSSIRIWHDGQWYDTEQQFLGMFMGDHSKTAINTSLNTGTVVGVSCNLFGGGVPKKFIPSFSWGGTDGLSTYRLADALDTGRRVMSRRGVVLSDEEKLLLRHVFEATARERDSGS